MSPVLVAQMKELTQQAKKENKILPVAEAFKMYPAEAKLVDEKIEYIKREKSKVEV